MRYPVTWIVVNTFKGYDFFINQLKELQNYSVEYYTSELGFNLYARVSGMSRQFAYEHFDTWGSQFGHILGCYFIKNNPSSSIRKLTEQEFRDRLKENDEIHYEVLEKVYRESLLLDTPHT